ARAEDGLRESEHRFRAVVQSETDAVVIADANGRMIFWNQGAQSMFGYSSEEMLGEPLTVIMPERYRTKHTAGFRRMYEPGVQRHGGRVLELNGLRADGEEFPLELSLSTWTTGRGRFVSAIIRDVSRRRRAEDAQRRVEEGFRAFIERFPEAVIIHKDGT